MLFWSFSRVVFALAASAAIVACSTAQNPVPAGPAQASTAARSDARGRHGRLRLIIRVPKRAHHPRPHRPDYISPATQGITIAVVGPTNTSVVAGLTATSAGCASTLASTTCTLSINDLAPCATSNCYVASIATYDAVSCTATCTIPGGAHELSAAQNVPFTVLAGQSNILNFTLGGIPASVAVTPLSPGYLQGDAHRLHLWGSQSQTLGVVAMDADGNAIFGAGAPAVSAKSGGASLVVAQPSASAPATVALRAATTGSPAVVTPGSVNLSITVTPPTDSGASPITAIVPVYIAHSAVMVSTFDGFIYTFYDGNVGAPNLTLTGSNTTLSEIGQIAVDGNGTLYVADVAGTGAVLEFPPGANGNVVPNVTIAGATTQMDNAYGVVVGPGGAIDIANPSGNSLTEYAQGASGNVAPATSISGAATGLFAPGCLALDSAGTLYVGNGGNVLEFAAGASGNAIPSASIAGSNTKLTLPHCVALDSAGNLYVLDVGGFIEEFAAGASGNAVPIRTISGGLTGLGVGSYGLALDAAGNLYSSNGDNVIEFAPAQNGNVAPETTISANGHHVSDVFAIPAATANVVTP